MDRRTTLKWVLAASASMPLLQYDDDVLAAPSTKATSAVAKPYGTDPNLVRVYKPGDLWPLTFTSEQRATAAVLCDLIIPADARSPSASSVGVVDFIDEWVSAPYETQRADRIVVLEGLQWLDQEAGRRFSTTFRQLAAGQQRQLCDDICYLPKVKPQFKQAAVFFARYRDLTAGGFYTTPQGRKDLEYIGNVPMASFNGPPAEVLKKVGLL
ncbi:gluconate 2-dehydrogenase subunit 3 family protein [Steroidobacter flavus]|uniref:Gluconate 2-dehydrogenase subunit 3 family protein n=1 Tax=Steroidobacter flavus TaxID=1842136 RepID=A0ABV8SWV0_9GAMM